MQIVTIELMDEKALRLLKELEQLNISRLISSEPLKPKQRERKWVGSISKKTASKMLASLEKSRSEWERNF